MAHRLGWWLTPSVTGEMTNKSCVNICDDARWREAAGARELEWVLWGVDVGLSQRLFPHDPRNLEPPWTCPPNLGLLRNTSCSGSYREAILGNLLTCCQAQSPLGCTTNVHYKNTLAVPSSSKAWHTDADHHKKRLTCFTFWGICHIILCCVATEFTFS